MKPTVRIPKGSAILPLALLVAACTNSAPPDRVRVSGQVEATDVQVGSQVAGRLLELRVAEGDRVKRGDVLAVVDAADAQLGLDRARADRDQAAAELRLVRAGSRPEDVRQAEAQVATATAEAAAADADGRGANVELAAAQADVERFEMLLASNSGSRKQRDDAVTRRDLANERVQAAGERAQAANQRVRAGRENLLRLRAGSRREEIDAAAARVASADAQIATWQKTIADATVTAPIAGRVTEKLADAGELVQARAPIVVLTDLDRAWANVYVDEPVVPRLRLGQAAIVYTDAGGAGIAGSISYISEKAEFTPRNVQTADDRSKLVYRVKIAVDNTKGVLKAGMPVEADIPF